MITSTSQCIALYSTASNPRGCNNATNRIVLYRLLLYTRPGCSIETVFFFLRRNNIVSQRIVSILISAHVTWSCNRVRRYYRIIYIGLDGRDNFYLNFQTCTCMVHPCWPFVSNRRARAFDGRRTLYIMYCRINTRGHNITVRNVPIYICHTRIPFMIYPRDVWCGRKSFGMFIRRGSEGVTNGCPASFDSNHFCGRKAYATIYYYYNI